MRQKGDNESCETLNNMSKGCMDSDDIKLINSRECSLSPAPPKEAIRPCGTREECDYHNEKMHSDLKSQLASEGADSIAHDRVQGSRSAIILSSSFIVLASFISGLVCK
jgi:hypothetical protein